MKKILIGLAAIVVLLVAAGFVVPALIDWKSYGAEIAEAVRDATGREQRIEGDISVSIVPLAVSIGDVRLSNADGMPSPEMFSVASVDVKLALFPLIGGSVVVDSLVVRQPAIFLEVDEEGRPNWVFEPAAPSPGVYHLWLCDNGVPWVLHSMNSDRAILNEVQWNQQGLVPAIAQDFSSREVLMLAWMNRDALVATIEEGRAVYWSRSRQALWRKGETSGHKQLLKEIRLDCDKDTILLGVEQLGGIACHTGRRHCFMHTLEDDRWQVSESVVEDPEDNYQGPP